MVSIVAAVFRPPTGGTSGGDLFSVLFPGVLLECRQEFRGPVLWISVLGQDKPLPAERALIEKVHTILGRAGNDKLWLLAHDNAPLHDEWLARD